MFEKYIKEILFEHGRVYVPKIGLISKNVVNQNTNSDPYTINQPVYSLEINQEYINDDDTWFLYAVARGEHVTLEEADVLIKQKADEILSSLRDGNEVNLYEIGTIAYVDGQLKFTNTVYADPSQFDENFGIPDQVVFKSEEREAIPSEEAYQSEDSTNESEPVIASETEFNPEPSEVKTFENYSQFYEEDNKGRRSRFFLIAASILILLVGAGVVYYFIGMTEGEPEETTLITDSEGELISEGEGDSIGIGSNTEDENTNNIEESTSSANKPLSIKEKGKRYYIIAGAFTINENAQKLKRRLGKKGVNAKILDPKDSSPLYRVSVDDFEEFNEALAKTTALKKKHGNSIWILKY